MAYNNRHRPSPHRKVQEPNAFMKAVNTYQDLSSAERLLGKASKLTGTSGKNLLGFAGAMALGVWAIASLFDKK